MNKFLKNIKDGYSADVEELDSADIVQTVLLIAGFALVVVVVVGFLGTSIINKGADVAECIEGANTFKEGDAGYKACKDADHAKENSFKKDSNYTNRYGE